MNAKPASFLGLIGTFRHKNTSFLARIIGVPKYGVKERRAVAVLFARHTHECQPVIGRPEIVEPLQAQFPPSRVVPEADGVAASVVTQPRVMEKGHRPIELDLRVLDPEYSASS